MEEKLSKDNAPLHITTDFINSLLAARELRRVRDILLELEPADIVDLITNLSLDNSIVIFRILPRDLATELFEFLPIEWQSELVNSLGNSRVKILLNDMAADDRTALFEELPAQITRRLLNFLNKEERQVALSLLGYPEDSIGRLMTPGYISIRQNWTIEQVLAHIRCHGEKSETFEIVYVLDQMGKLIGEVPIREILLSHLNTSVTEISSRPTNHLSAYSNQEEAIPYFRKYGVSVLPVVDSKEKLIGIVTIDDVLDVAAEAATEDIQKFGGSEALEQPYLATPWSTLLRSRAGWLVILFIGEMATASAMTAFEEELDKIVVLAIFLPLIIASGGNSGSQAATLVIRALSLGEITVKDWVKILKRELLTGAALGAILGLIGFLRVGLWSVIFGDYEQTWLPLSISVSIALVFVVLWGTLSGAMFPLLLKRLGADPATSSAPFVATVVDVVGLVIYFSIASRAFQYFS
jgi:magnesium transporter